MSVLFVWCWSSTMLAITTYAIRASVGKPIADEHLFIHLFHWVFLPILLCFWLILAITTFVVGEKEHYFIVRDSSLLFLKRLLGDWSS